jgi:hypothetical protein
MFVFHFVLRVNVSIYVALNVETSYEFNKLTTSFMTIPFRHNLLLDRLSLSYSDTMNWR